MNDTTLNNNVKDEKTSSTQTDKHETWKIKGYSLALIAASVIGTVAVLSAAVYSSYWWGSGESDEGIVSNGQTANPDGSSEVAPAPADIEPDAINLGE